MQNIFLVYIPFQLDISYTCIRTIKADNSWSVSIGTKCFSFNCNLKESMTIVAWKRKKYLYMFSVNPVNFFTGYIKCDYDTYDFP